MTDVGDRPRRVQRQSRRMSRRRKADAAATPRPQMSREGAFSFAAYWLWILCCTELWPGCAQAVGNASADTRAGATDSTTVAVSSSSNASVWTDTEGLLLGSIITADKSLWGPVITPPWQAFVSARASCDLESERVFFTSDKRNWSAEAFSHSSKHAILKESPLLTTVKGVYTVLGCLLACVHSKNFTCKSIDYYWKDGGRCLLHNITGQIENIYWPRYSTTSDGSDHYDLLANSSCPEPATPYASHNFASLGWQAFAVGWTELAIYEFDRAIGTGEHSLTAYLGRSLSHEAFGFGLPANRSYSDIITRVVSGSDLELRLSMQEQLYYRAQAAMLNSNNLTEGSLRFSDVINQAVGPSSDKRVVDRSQYALGLTLSGVALLNVNLSVGTDALLLRVRSGDMTAMAYLTKRLDPYNNGHEVLKLFEQATEAARAFYDAYVSPQAYLCRDLIRSSANILEGYSRWTFAAQILLSFSSPDLLSLLVTRGLLSYERRTYYLRGTGLVFTTNDDQMLQYERAHFQQLQAARFLEANYFLKKTISAYVTSNSSFERSAAYRAIATAYFATSGPIYPDYANKINFTIDASVDTSSDELSLFSKGYYELAKYTKEANASRYPALETTLIGYLSHMTSGSQYQRGVEMLLSIARSKEYERTSDMQKAIEEARKASELQTAMANTTMGLPNVSGSHLFRLLLPLGHVHYGELLKRAADSPSQTNKTALLDACEAAFISAVNALPRNTSKALYSLGMLYYTSRYKPELALDYLLTLTKAWNSTGDAAKASFPGLLATIQAVQTLQLPSQPGCRTDIFDVNVGCYGFWVLIAIALAVIVIAGVTTVVLCTRRRIRRPVTDKDDVGDFVFKGPKDLLSPDTNTLSSLYRYGNTGSAKSLDSCNHELAEVYKQETNDYYTYEGEMPEGFESEASAVPPSDYNGSTFAPTTLERSQQPQALYDRVKRRGAPTADEPHSGAVAATASTMERGFSVPKDFQ